MGSNRQPTKLFFSLLFVILGISVSGKPAIDVALSQESTQRQSSLQRLANGNYKVCSKPPSTSIDTGYCFVFRKSGNRVVGDYYDTKTLGEEGVCMSGTLSNRTVRGEAIEEIGSVGRQNTPPNSSGKRLVNWDKEGYLKVARASVLRTYEVPHSYKTVRYRSALLNLNSFSRYNAGTQSPPRTCLKQ